MKENKIKIGVICPSEVAFRRFLPSLKQVEGIEYVGVAVATPEEWANGGKVDDKVKSIITKEYEKAEKFRSEFGGVIFRGYQNMIESDRIDAVYLPLPPSLHKKWAEKALKAGKHAYVEKPFTTSIEDTEALLNLAREKGLAVHENYMFVFHRQMKEVKRIVESGELGKVRQYSVSFGFPLRPAGDFRYIKSLGGGALLDAGGYCIKFASWILGPMARLEYANLKYEPEYEVDIFGSGVMRNEEGVTVNFSFGMDCDYKCSLEAWGSKGTLSTGRILTAPDGLEPDMTIKHNQEYIASKLPGDKAFCNSICRFIDCVRDEKTREDNYQEIERQSAYLSEFKKLSGYEE